MGTNRIKLGSQEFELAPLTLKQLREVLPKMASLATITDQQQIVDRSVEIVVSALRVKYPEVNEDNLSGTMPEVQSAIEAIGRVSGLVPVGEAVAAET